MLTIEPPPFTYHNPIWRLVRIFLILAAALAVLGVPALLATVHLDAPATRDSGVAAACLVVAALALPGAVAMLLSALLTIPNARKADRVFESFRKHECLAEWTYADAEWRSYVLSEETRLGKAGFVIAGLVGGVCLAVWLIIAWSAGSTWQGRLIGMALGAAGSMAVAGIILGSNRLYIVARRRRLSSCPRAFLGRNALFCGGDFAYWGSNMLALRSARLLEGQPPQLEFIVGTGGAARNIALAADVVSTLAGHATGTSRMTWRYTVLIPKGRMTEAQAALRTILAPPEEIPAAAPASTAPAAAHPTALPQAPPKPAAAHLTAQPPPKPAAIPAATPPRPIPASSPSAHAGLARASQPGRRLHLPAWTARPAAWWWTTAALVFGGLGMFLISGAFHGGAETATAVLGLFMWCAAPITLIAAAVVTVKHWHSRSAR